MSADPEDDALTWVGDEAPVVEREPVPQRVATASAPEDREPVPAVLLVTYGLLAGIYLIYAVGWAVAMQRNTIVQPDALGAFMFTLGEVLAVASPAIWFGTVIVLTRGRKPLPRLLALLAGLVVVIPWPFVLGV